MRGLLANYFNVLSGYVFPHVDEGISPSQNAPVVYDKYGLRVLGRDDFKADPKNRAFFELTVEVARSSQNKPVPIKLMKMDEKTS